MWGNEPQFREAALPAELAGRPMSWPKRAQECPTPQHGNPGVVNLWLESSKSIRKILVPDGFRGFPCGVHCEVGLGDDKSAKMVEHHVWHVMHERKPYGM